MKNKPLVVFTDRRRVTKEGLKREKHLVTQFVLTRIQPDPLVKWLKMKDIFDVYSREYQTHLTIDGFGRLFPKNVFPRKSMSKDGKSFKVVVGVKVV